MEKALSDQGLKNLKPWKPGQSGNPAGRRKHDLSRIAELLSKDGKHPYIELMKLLPQLRPKEQADIWLQLLSYCFAKPKEEDKEDDSERKALENIPEQELIVMVKERLHEIEGKAG